jgi:hypothetical protein
MVSACTTDLPIMVSAYDYCLPIMVSACTTNLPIMVSACITNLSTVAIDIVICPRPSRFGAHYISTYQSSNCFPFSTKVFISGLWANPRNEQ